ncbi:MAG: dihydropteroate synthase [Calditrichaeota bacterium]|nr:dihydropteroate synthase [Calditrichota bacterium]
MGILNITPDSFSDGGRYLDAGRAVVQAEAMLAAGADIIDIGGESTRPGAAPLDAAAEWERVAPVLRRLARKGRGLISIDTSKSEVAERALGEGAHIINDITALRGDARLAKVAAAHHAPLVLMHMQGTPRTMQQKPGYENLLEEVLTLLAERCRFAREQGVSDLIVDPGIGFGKRLEDNYELLRRLGELRVLGYPLLLGASRKSFIGNLLEVPVDQRLYGSLAAALIGVARGAHMLRVHDVAQTRQVLEVFRGMETLKAGGETA